MCNLALAPSPPEADCAAHTIRLPPPISEARPRRRESRRRRTADCRPESAIPGRWIGKPAVGCESYHGHRSAPRHKALVSCHRCRDIRPRSVGTPRSRGHRDGSELPCRPIWSSSFPGTRTSPLMQADFGRQFGELAARTPCDRLVGGPPRSAPHRRQGGPGFVVAHQTSPSS